MEGPPLVPSVSRAFWWVAAAALVWNLLGLAAFVFQILIPEVGLASLPDEQRALYQAMPWWGVAAYAAAVIGGTLGAVALLRRQRWAVPAFAVSVVGLVIQNIQSFAVLRVQDVMGWGAAAMPLVILAVAVALLVWSRRLARDGRLR